jgi:predicted glycosyltransferase
MFFSRRSHSAVGDTAPDMAALAARDEEGTGDLARSRPAGVMFYSHDTYGLGHLRRTLTLARHLPANRPALSQLIVTGSPLAHRFTLPPGTDYLKLPSVLKMGVEDYEPRYLRVPFSDVRDLRMEILLSAARHVRPRMLIVDNVPRGLKGELVPTLRFLKDQGCLLVLGLRDVVDEGDWVRRAWERDASYELLDEVYDLILVYGRRDLYDITAEYAFSPRAEKKTRFVGYLGREPPARDIADVRAELGVGSDRLVLVMAGGGGDGYQLLSAVVEAIRLRGDRGRFDCLLLGGPLMPPEDRRRVLAMAESETSIRYIDFVDDVASYVAAADIVVSMGGYNSVCELLSAGKSAIVVPRTAPRREQLIRAEALSRRGLLRMIHPELLTGERLLDEIDHLFDWPAANGAGLPLDGLSGAAVAIDELLATQPSFAVSG